MKNATQIKAEMTETFNLIKHLETAGETERAEMAWELYFKLEDQLKAAC